MPSRRIVSLAVAGVLLWTGVMFAKTVRQVQPKMSPAEAGLRAKLKKLAQDKTRAAQQRYAQQVSRSTQLARARFRDLKNKALIKGVVKKEVPGRKRYKSLPSNARDIIHQGGTTDPQSGPQIQGVTPRTVPYNIQTTVSITGARFGSSRGRVTLQLLETNSQCSIVQWSDWRVDVRLPRGLFAVIGENIVEGRLWLYTQQGKIATDTLTITPDPTIYKPVIDRVSGVVRFGQSSTIEGKYFLPRPWGTVRFIVPRARGPVTVPARILNWETNAIHVAWPGRPITLEAGIGEIVVENYIGATGRKDLYFEPKMETRFVCSPVHTIRDESLPGIAGELGGQREIFTDHVFALGPGWKVAGSRIDIIEGHNTSQLRVFWRRRPEIGTTNPTCQVRAYTSLRDSWARFIVSVELEGPTGVYWQE